MAAGCSHSPTGRRLLAPRSLAIIEREYLRFGIVGIFISRFLPGIRAVVPPFAGLVGLGAIRTLAPMGLASAIWYGGHHHPRARSSARSGSASAASSPA